MLIATLAGLFAASCKDGAVKEEPFRYLADEFADLKVIRYRIPGWDSLTLQQKEYIYHLSEAAKAGRDIFWDQNFKHGIKIRRALEGIFENYSGEKESSDWKEFVVYAKRVFFSNGIHHHYAEEKFIPGCSQEYFAKLMDESGQSKLKEELIPMLFDPALYPYRKNITGEGDLLLGSSVNFYDSVSRAEAETFYAKMADPKDETPISYGLNSRLVKRGGVVQEEVYKSGGLYGAAIDKIIEHLEKASAVAENDIQRGYIAKLIDYYRTGDLNTWDEYNIAWVKDTDSQVDFINGFIEDYNDPLGMKATWEAVVNFKDIEASKRTEIISNNAQWFEDNSPVSAEYKKKEVKGVSAKVITVAQLGGDCHPTSPLGINLPNADWIRKEHGSKSVTIANISEAYDKAAEEAPKSMTAEFSWDEAESALIKQYGSVTNNLHTDMHECLGHASGQLRPGTAAGALKDHSSALEEARADIFALYYMPDTKLVELGIMPDAEAYKASYISYIRNGLMTQFVRVELGKSVTQAHMQGRKLIAEWCFEKGKGAGEGGADVIEKRVRDNKTYFVINDYAKLRGLFGDLLAELQRVKSEGDYAAGKKLIETYAVNIDPALHKEVRDRYASLNLKPYGGFINPDIIPVEKDGKITDYKIEYPADFLQQMLDYGKKYSFLK
ncbi:MAG: dihydrofolate reductase [Bacteroidales bacterium]|nr:dihydrofolate reductase [Bacteroidales bacterium]MBP8678283.1 dihydrofolate reductase [Bacteroidales bacterium]MBP9584862.1 dihydrofolate reductase [Bacteroidales bacterium]